MKIAVLAPFAFPVREPYAGGQERHTAQLVRGMAARGHSVTLLARPGSDAPEGVRLLPITGGYAAALRQLRAGGFDIVHNNSLDYLPVLTAWRMNCPVVTTLHTPPYRALRLAARVGRWSDRLHFVTVSAFMQRLWAPYTGRSTIIYNGIDPQAWPFSPQGEPRRAVWSGRISPEKGTEYAIAAASQAGYALDLAGPIHDQAYFAREVSPYLNDRIRYHGSLSGTELARLMGGAGVGLFTSVWDEPFGLVIPEMLACGTPVAGFGSGAATELLYEGVGQLVEKRDVTALVTAMNAAARLQRRHCRAHSERNFHLETMISGYEELYRRILNRR
ncbi:glycosyltransferase family 4 protein [Neolewinella litorea]|uniref:Glycosyltransferase family 4 protein n=1 Tax=Neolewinella litorea TaxID=2562452 RepID=A0A4S4NN83_9BACT|nr:glycosyltransferase family 4 protein [Neolewinella litorea]THH39828.1 glycosyltransferase family 4 protein [Neolewinella litorea]